MTELQPGPELDLRVARAMGEQSHWEATDDPK